MTGAEVLEAQPSLCLGCRWDSYPTIRAPLPELAAGLSSLFVAKDRDVGPNTRLANE